MKRLLPLAVLAAALSIHAQTVAVPVGSLPRTAPAPLPVDAAKLAKVEKLFDEMHIERSTEQMMDLMRRMIVQATENDPAMSAATPQQKQLVVDYQEKAMQLAANSVGWKAMRPEYERIYAADFTDEELDGMIVFYATPAGKAMLDRSPEIAQQTMGMVQQRMTALQPQIRDLMQQLAGKLKAATPPSSAPPAPAKASPAKASPAAKK